MLGVQRYERFNTVDGPYRDTNVLTLYGPRGRHAVFHEIRSKHGRYGLGPYRLRNKHLNHYLRNIFILFLLDTVEVRSASVAVGRDARMWQ